MNWKQRTGVVAGNAAEFYDIAVFAAISGYLASALTQQGVSNAIHIIWGIFALRFLIRPLGGYLIGRYADKAGRKQALILTSSLTGVATVMMALLPVNTLGSGLPVVLLLLQMMQALSFGGEYPTLITYLFSDTAEKDHSKTSSLIVSSSIVGVLFSLLLVMGLENVLNAAAMQQYGWRIPLLLGAANIVLSFWFRFRLPEQPVTLTKSMPVDRMKVAKIFMITVPGAVVFYVQNMASSLLRDVLQFENLKTIYPVFSSGLLLLALLLCGWLTDKLALPRQVFKTGIISLILLAPPLYFVLGSNSLWLIIPAQLALTAITAMILSNLAAVLSSVAEGQTVSLGLGYNLALSLFGGLSPLVVSTLLPFGAIFPGLYISVCGLVFFITVCLPATKTTPALSEPRPVRN